MTQKSCTQTVQTYTPLYACKYYLQTWGAQGATGTSSYGIGTGGKGGYAYGYSQISNANDVLYVVVGGVGTCVIDYGGTNNSAETKYAGYNGGGYGQSGGGGATHISKVTGLLKDLSSHANNGNIYLVAGGGGGPDNWGIGGYGGGLTGGTGEANGSYTNGTGGSTNGNSGSGGTGIGRGSFGQGGNVGTTDNDSAGGGGGGWFGGGSSGEAKSASGGGGSSWYGGVSDGGTIAGNASLPNPNAASGNITGNSGDGRAKVTCLPYD